jgi:hypothetical protein
LSVIDFPELALERVSRTGRLPGAGRHGIQVRMHGWSVDLVITASIGSRDLAMYELSAAMWERCGGPATSRMTLNRGRALLLKPPLAPRHGDVLAGATDRLARVQKLDLYHTNGPAAPNGVFIAATRFLIAVCTFSTDLTSIWRTRSRHRPNSPASSLSVIGFSASLRASKMRRSRSLSKERAEASALWRLSNSSLATSVVSWPGRHARRPTSPATRRNHRPRGWAR